MNLLLAIDRSEASAKAVRFVGEVLKHHPSENLSITLFHVIESLPDFIVHRSQKDESGNIFQEVAEKWMEENKAEGERLLSVHKDNLVQAGISEASLETKLAVKEGLPESKKVVAALAIIEEMQQSPFTVVCLGRRGTSPAVSTFPGSVAEKVLREAEGKTVWVVD